MVPTSNKVLLEEVAVWKHNRSVYPGWLIAPEPVRERIWNATRHWIAVLVRHWSELPLNDQFESLFELNWRLETALVPVWQDLVPAFSHILDKVNPFPTELVERQDCVTSLTDKQGVPLSASELRGKWLSLAFAFLRFHREELHITEFEALAGQLKKLVHLRPDLHARLCYESAMLRLSQLDDDAVGSILGEWPDKTEDVFWAVRKAALLAEIGKPDAARTMIESLLPTIRASLRVVSTHIPNLSREGWIMRLAHALGFDHRLRSGQGVDDGTARAELRSRFQELRGLGCSPSDITDHFEDIFRQPEPREKTTSETKVGFAPGTASQTIHMGSEVSDQLVHGYQYHRLVEEAAFPPMIGHTTLSKGGLRRVAEWMSEFDPVRTQSLLSRLLDSDLTQLYLSRHRIAALPESVVQRFRQLAIRGITQVLAKTRRVLDHRDPQDARDRNRLEFSIRLLARVSALEREETIGQAWDLAIRLYSDSGVRSTLTLDRPLSELFESLVESSSPERTKDQLSILFALPIPGEGDCNFAGNPFDWPDPSTIAARPFKSPIWSRPPNAYRGTVDRLLRIAQLSEGFTKQLSFFRLLRLNDLGALSKTQKVRLAKMFWSQLGSRTGLPSEPWGPWTPWVALELTPPRGIDAAGRLKQRILAGQPGKVDPFVVPSLNVFDLIAFASHQPSDERPKFANRWYLDWTNAEACKLFEMTRFWWDNNGKQQLKEIREKSWVDAFHSTGFRAFVSRVWDALRLVIIPMLGRRKSVIAAVRTLVEDMQQSGLPIGAVLPATLIWDQSSTEIARVATVIRQELANQELEVYLAAMRGIVFWVECSANARVGRGSTLPEIPKDLLREVGTAVLLRRKESLSMALDCAYNVVRRLKRRSDNQFVQNLIIGLRFLLEETKYRENLGTAQRFEYDEIPIIRFRSARLAKCLADCGHQTDTAIQEWCKAAAIDPLPEIRRLVSEPLELAGELS